MGAGGLSALIPTGGDSHSARSDLMEAECTELLLRVFKHLRNLSMDGRPEVRGVMKMHRQAALVWGLHGHNL